MARETVYITTPIYYPNDIPHIGTAYTTIAADILARWHALKGKKVFFLTGTDEHGKKIELAAKEKNKSPKEFVDEIYPAFVDAWKKLNIQYSRFIRTTDKDHELVIKKILEKVNTKKDIYLGEYEGYYCTSCEAYYTETEAPDLSCPVHKKELEKLKEQSYFFRLSKYQKKLLEMYKKNKYFILPEFRRNEIIKRVEEGLQDLSISRTTFSWGIQLPFDKTHITYVWFDALANYLTGVGYEKNKIMFKKFWPADVHFVGKDILWFHAVIWPAMLMSLNLPLPKTIFAHGWWTINKEKISKSRGNIINVDQLIALAGVDAARYFLFRETPFGEDGDFSKAMLLERNNNELANKLGNLVSRVSALIEKYGMQKTPNKLIKKLQLKNIDKETEHCQFDKALQHIFSFIDVCNEYIQHKKPWETQDKKVLYELADSIKAIAIVLSPYMPETTETIAKQFHFSINYKEIKKPLSIKPIKKAEVLFRKRE
jgi:methionyl-tRNA synthetase